MLNPPANGKIKILFKAFECFSSTFQGKFYFQGLFKTVLYIQVLFMPVRTLFNELECFNNVHWKCHYLVYTGKTWKRLPENPEYAEMCHGDVILTSQWRHGSTYGEHAAVSFFHSLGPGLWDYKNYECEGGIEYYFLYFSSKTYGVGTQKNRLNETVPLSTQNTYSN